MASWKKILHSGSAAELASLALDTPLPVPSGGTGRSSVTSGNFLLGNGSGALTLVGSNGSGNVVRSDGATLTNMVGTGSFTGSFVGDGSGLTGINAGNINAPGLDTEVIFNDGGDFGTDVSFTFNKTSNVLTVGGSDFGANVSTSGTATVGNLASGTNSDNVIIDGGSGILKSRGIDSRVWGSSLVDGSGASTRVSFWTDSNTITSDAQFTFNSTTNILTVSGSDYGNAADIAGTATVGNLTAGINSNNVIIDGGSGILKSRTIDSKVWGSSLIDGSGASTQVAFWSDGDTITGDADYTYNSTSNVLTIDGSTFGENVEIAGNLTVLGDTLTANVANLEIEDRFILLNSGSATGDGGIIVQNAAGGNGVALGWDDSESRFGVQLQTTLGSTATAIAPDSYVALAVSGSGAAAEEQKLGNIRTDGDEIYIWA